MDDGPSETLIHRAEPWEIQKKKAIPAALPRDHFQPRESLRNNLLPKSGFGLIFNTSYQGGLTEQLASSHQVANGYVEIRVATAPVGDLGEGVSDENILVEHKTDTQHAREPQFPGGAVDTCHVPVHFSITAGQGCLL